jgi:GGDEF domain-containing protein
MAIGSPKPEVPQPLSVTSHDGVCWNKADGSLTWRTDSQPLGVSLGVATCLPTVDASPTRLLARADIARPNAQKQGRNRVAAAH